MKKLILSALALALLGAAPAYAQEGAGQYQYGVGSAKTLGAAEQYGGDTSNAPPDVSGGVAGTVTEISGSVVLVEEDPSSDSGGKGYFTVTDETEVGRLVGGDALAPAAFEDLAVGQTVEAAYAGEFMESYPTQGNAASIAILEEDVDCPFPGGCDDTATLSLELAVEGEPPAGTAFSGVTEIESFIATPLTDPDGDGLYTGSLTVPANSGGQGGPPEPLSLPVRIVQDGATVIKDFGPVLIDGDKTFEASVSFGGSEPPPSGEEVVATGVPKKLEAEPVVVDGVEICGLSTHAITDEATGRRYDLTSEAVDLDGYVGKRVAAFGTPLASPAIGGAGAERCPDLDVTRVELLDDATKPPPPPGNVGGSDDGGNAPGTGGASGGGDSGGGALGGITTLPATGGAWTIAGLAGLVLIAGGILARRGFTR